MSSRDYQFCLRVAQLAAHVLWEHGVGSSNLSAETSIRGACGAVAALRDVTPADVGSIPTTHPIAHPPLVAEQGYAPVSETGAHGHVRSTRTEGTRQHFPAP